MQPSTGSQTGRGGYYVLKMAERGSSIQSLGFRNDSKNHLNLQLAAVDAITGPIGGVSYGLPDDPVKKTGAWISLEKKRVSLGPGQSKTVRFRVEVPPDTEPGTHLAGIAAWVPKKDETSKVQPGEPGASIEVQTRKIIAVQINLGGPSEPNLRISGVEADPRTDAVYLEVGIENDGYGLTSGSGTINLPGIGFQKDLELDTFVPGTSIAYPIKWEVTPEDGEYEAIVNIDYQNGKGHAEWEGTFTVGQAVSEELDKRRGTSGFPWLLFAAGTVALIGLVYVGMRLRARSSVPATTGSAVGPVSGSPTIGPSSTAPNPRRSPAAHAAGRTRQRRDVRVPPPPPPPRTSPPPPPPKRPE